MLTLLGVVATGWRRQGRFVAGAVKLTSEALILSDDPRLTIIVYTSDRENRDEADATEP